MSERLEDLLQKTCPHPGHNRGGVHTNFDPYGARPLVGLQKLDWRFICWPCYREWGARLAELLDGQLRAAFDARGLCGYLEPYRGFCFLEKPCIQHTKERCWKCKAPATSGCSSSGAFVCGVPQCDEHPHHAAHQEEAQRREVERQAVRWGL